MSAADVDLVRAALALALDPPEGGEVVLTDEFFGARLEGLLAADAPVEFATPDGGFVGDMAGPFFGYEGFRAGWAEWLAPWDSFVFAPTDLIDAGGGLVLVLGECHGRLAGSGAELDTAAAALYEVRDGRIVRIQHFLDQAQARRAAGLDP